MEQPRYESNAPRAEREPAGTRRPPKRRPTPPTEERSRKMVKRKEQRRTDRDGESGPPEKLAQMCCSGYVFSAADGRPFDRSDVEPVAMDVSGDELDALSSTSTSRLVVEHGGDGSPNAKEEFQFHMCEEDAAPAGEPRANDALSFRVSNRCNAWVRLSPAQREALDKIQERVDTDRADGRRFTCAIIEGPGGCGKTRLLSHLINHGQFDSLVLYVTKQNKRVQDFIHADCLNGETDPSVQKPVDLTPKYSDEIAKIVRSHVGRYAVTAEKLLFAVSGLRPSALGTAATPGKLGIDYVAFRRRKRAAGSPAPARNVVVLLDEYTMLQSPLIHALAYHVMNASGSPLVLVMAGDKLQCGPVGWRDSGRENAGDDSLFTGDVRRDISVKMAYDPLDLTMDKLQRCAGDTALGGCVKRLRRVCEDAGSNSRSRKKNLLHLILTRYCVEAGVDLYMQEPLPGGASLIRKVVPADAGSLDFGGAGFPAAASERLSFDAYMSRLEEEEYDESGVAFRPCDGPPVVPTYDLLPLVEHFVALYTRLAGLGDAADQRWTDAVCESAAAVRHLFPVFIVLTNNSCNALAETFLLALYAQVRARLLSGRAGPERERLERTLRRNVRCLTIDPDDALQRQTLFVGMVYKMTSTFKASAGRYLCNGETVVLASIEYRDGGADRLSAVRLRKLQRDAGVDFTLLAGHNRNRMTNDAALGVMPFVPYVSENIYQMQGNTVPAGAKTFVDLVNVPCDSAYVAMSRFQDSRSIGGVVVSE